MRGRGLGRAHASGEPAAVPNHRHPISLVANIAGKEADRIPAFAFIIGASGLDDAPDLLGFGTVECTTVRG